MEEQHYRGLHQFIKENAGSTYRAAFAYEGDDWETLYVRDDVATERLAEQMPGVIERARNTKALLREDDYPPLGETRATTEVHDDGVILHFPDCADGGILVSLDRDAARDLTAFVERAISRLETGS